MENKRKKILSFTKLEIGFVSGKFRHILLPPVDGTADEGELIAVIGRNGIGKSTLLRTLTGLQHLISGDLRLDSKPVQEYSRISLSAKIGYISTEIVKVSNMRVYDLVSLGRFPHTNWMGRINESDEKTISEAIIMTGMHGLRERPVTELSDGERQRTMIAMLLAQDTKIMVMDEPTAFLDISSKFEIIHLLLELTRTRKKTIIFSTHDLTTAVSQADKIWLLKGEGLIEGAPEDLMLKEAFTHLFDESKVKYNAADGSFAIRNEEKGAVTLRGDGEKKYWTEKALVRAGYSISDSKSALEIETPSEINEKWRCRTPGNSKEFTSIYELVTWIRDSSITC